MTDRWSAHAAIAALAHDGVPTARDVTRAAEVRGIDPDRPNHPIIV